MKRRSWLDARWMRNTNGRTRAVITAIMVMIGSASAMAHVPTPSLAPLKISVHEPKTLTQAPILLMGVRHSPVSPTPEPNTVKDNAAVVASLDGFGVARWGLATALETWRRAVQRDGFLQTEERIHTAAAAPLSTDRVELASFYAATNLYPECLFALGEAPADIISTKILHAFCAIGAHRPDRAWAVLKDEPDSSADALALKIVTLTDQGRYVRARQKLETLWPVWDVIDPVIRALLAPSVLDVAGETAASVDDDAFRIAIQNAPLEQVQMTRARILLRAGAAAQARHITGRVQKNADGALAVRAAVLSLKIDLETENIAPADVLVQAQQLSLRWGGGPAARELSAVIASAHFALGDTTAAFHALRDLMRADPQSDAARQAQARITGAMAALVEDDANNVIIENVQTFLAFVDFAPPGAAGDRLIRDYAARLDGLGLGAQAAELLEHQVFQRLRGQERARVAMDLSQLYLEQGAAESALRVLRSTRHAGLSAPVLDGRRALEAQALASTGRVEKALALLESVSTPSVHRQRADILWSAARWADAAKSYELAFDQALVDGAPINDVDADLAVRAAVSYGLSDDQEGLTAFVTRVDADLTARPERALLKLLRDGLAAGTFFDVYRAVYPNDRTAQHSAVHSPRGRSGGRPIERTNERTAGRTPASQG